MVYDRVKTQQMMSYYLKSLFLYAMRWIAWIYYIVSSIVFFVWKTLLGVGTTELDHMERMERISSVNKSTKTIERHALMLQKKDFERIDLINFKPFLGLKHDTVDKSLESRNFTGGEVLAEGD